MTWVVLVCFVSSRHFIHRVNALFPGAFDADCRTLYVGGLRSDSEVERILWKEFGEWGTPEVVVSLFMYPLVLTSPQHINVVRRLNIGFVRYHNRLNAEFAKAAMADQAWFSL